MLSQMTNFSVTPNFSNKAPVAHPAIAYSWADSFETMGTSMSFPRNAEIYGENEPAEYLYKLVSGSVRVSKILNDGRRQISAFYLPGDVFGLEISSEHALSAEAITDVEIILVKRSAIEALAARDTDFARQLWAGEIRHLSA